MISLSDSTMVEMFADNSPGRSSRSIVRRELAGIVWNRRTTMPACVWKRNSRRAAARFGLATAMRVVKNDPVAPSAR